MQATHLAENLSEEDAQTLELKKMAEAMEAKEYAAA